MSRGSSRGSSRRSSSTPSPTPRVRVPQHVARLVTRLVVDYFTCAARPVALARRAACRVTRRRLLRLAQARRRLLRLRRASGCLSTPHGSSHRAAGCLSTSRGSSCRSSLTTSPTPRVRVPRHITWLISPLIVDYFASAAHPGASARRAAPHVARRRLLCAPRLRLAATPALLQPRRVSRRLVSRKHWLDINYVARRRDVVFWLHRVDYSSRLVENVSHAPNI
jgi:hypothetical protein